MLAPILRGGAFEHLFNDDKLAVLLRSENSGQEYIYNEARVHQRFIACSTFKIPNSLIALDSGVVSSKAQVFRYDPAKHAHPNRTSPEYNRDQTLESAFAISALWTFQEIAKVVEEEQYRRYLDLFNYGNEDISGGIDTFWLKSLRISAREQVEFLESFHRNDFQLREDAVRATIDIMQLEKAENYTVHGKTGTRLPKDGNWLGWIVGFIETETDVVYFAINLDRESYRELASARADVLATCIENLQILFPKGVANPSPCPRPAAIPDSSHNP